MEESLKQRLTGALVITSLAAIFIPMLFDNPVDETGKMINELKIPKPQTSIDLVTLPKRVATEVKQAKPAPLKIKKKTNQQPKFSADKKRWFIQLGTFSQKNNATLLQNKIRKQGFSATIKTTSGNNGLLYKVRVGPTLDRERAEVIKKKLNKLNNMKTFLIFIE